MSIALDSPLEALAINYLSFGFLTAVNNIWTWVAVIAGAVSFIFTIRKPVTPLTDPIQPDPKTHDPVHTTCSPVTLLPGFSQTMKPDPQPVSSCRGPQDPEKNPTRIPYEAEPTRGKFTVYYMDGDMAGTREDDDVDVCHVAERESRGWEWEGMMRMRILTGEEMGWYRYQDLTAIDGNVVRLWDGCRV